MWCSTRQIFLKRLSDLLIDGILVSSRQSMDIHQWRENLRRGELRIEVKGYSHVFAPFADSNTISEDLQLKLPGVHACYQEVFGRKQVRDLILSLYHNKSSLPIRKSIGDYKPWQEHSPQLPAPGTLWKTQASKNAETKQNGAIPTQKPATHQYQDMSHGKGETLDLGEEHSEAATDILKGLLSPPSPSVSSGMSTAVQTNIGQIAPQTVKHEKNDQWSREILDTLQRALLSYSLQAKVLGSRLTPNTLLIRLKGSDRLRVEDIEKKKSVLLTTHGLSILNIIAQPGEIVVSIARPQRETVSLQEVWRQRDLFVSPGEINLCFILGIKEMDGEILYLNLGKSLDHLPNHAPHTLIAGTTGSEKSVLMQNLLLDVCKTNSSQFAHIYLIDPKKGVDYQQLLGLPHLREGIITEQGRAQEILSLLVDQMEQRYELLSKANVSNLIDYNRKVGPNERVPVLWLVHDEFADWMLVDEYKEAVSTSVQRLGTKARAAGIHLIFAAQRPDANVLPPQLRDNLGNRLILRVESQGTSEIALGEKGAEKLLGKGHLAAKLGGEITYAQVPFLSSEEQVQVVEEIRKQSYV